MASPLIRAATQGVVISLNLNAKDFTKGLAEAQSRATSAMDKIGIAGQRASGYIMTGAQTSALELAGLGIAVKQVVDEFSKFEATVVQAAAMSQRMTGSTEEFSAAVTKSAKNFGDFASKLSQEFPVAAQDIAEGMVEIAKSGVQATEMLIGLQGVMELATLSGKDMASVGEVVVQVGNQFDISFARAKDITDLFIKSIGDSPQSFEKMREGLKQAGSISAEFGNSLEETTAALNVLVSSGRQGGEAGTAVRNMLATLAEGSAKTEKILKGAGLSLQTLNPELNSTGELIQKLSDSALSAGEIFDIFGKRTAGQILTLMKGAERAKDGMGGLKKSIEDLNKIDPGAVVGEILKTTQAQLIETKNSFLAFVREVGATIAPVVSDIAKFLAGVFKTLTSFVQGPFGKFSLLVAGIATGVRLIGNTINIATGLLLSFMKNSVSTKAIYNSIGTTIKSIIGLNQTQITQATALNALKAEELATTEAIAVVEQVVGAKKLSFLERGRKILEEQAAIHKARMIVPATSLLPQAPLGSAKSVASQAPTKNLTAYKEVEAQILAMEAERLALSKKIEKTNFDIGILNKQNLAMTSAFVANDKEEVILTQTKLRLEAELVALKKQEQEIARFARKQLALDTGDLKRRQAEQLLLQQKLTSLNVQKAGLRQTFGKGKPLNAIPGMERVEIDTAQVKANLAAVNKEIAKTTAYLSENAAFTKAELASVQSTIAATKASLATAKTDLLRTTQLQKTLFSSAGKDAKIIVAETAKLGAMQGRMSVLNEKITKDYTANVRLAMRERQEMEHLIGLEILRLEENGNLNLMGRRRLATLKEELLIQASITGDLQHQTTAQLMNHKRELAKIALLKTETAELVKQNIIKKQSFGQELKSTLLSKGFQPAGIKSFNLGNLKATMATAQQGMLGLGATARTAFTGIVAGAKAAGAAISTFLPFAIAGAAIALVGFFADASRENERLQESLDETKNKVAELDEIVKKSKENRGEGTELDTTDLKNIGSIQQEIENAKNDVKALQDALDNLKVDKPVQALNDYRAGLTNFHQAMADGASTWDLFKASVAGASLEGLKFAPVFGPVLKALGLTAGKVSNLDDRLNLLGIRLKKGALQLANFFADWTGGDTAQFTKPIQDLEKAYADVSKKIFESEDPKRQGAIAKQMAKDFAKGTATGLAEADTREAHAEAMKFLKEVIGTDDPTKVIESAFADVGSALSSLEKDFIGSIVGDKRPLDQRIKQYQDYINSVGAIKEQLDQVDPFSPEAADLRIQLMERENAVAQTRINTNIKGAEARLAQLKKEEASIGIAIATLREKENAGSEQGKKDIEFLEKRQRLLPQIIKRGQDLINQVKERTEADDFSNRAIERAAEVLKENNDQVKKGLALTKQMRGEGLPEIWEAEVLQSAADHLKLVNEQAQKHSQSWDELLIKAPAIAEQLGSANEDLAKSYEKISESIRGNIESLDRMKADGIKLQQDLIKINADAQGEIAKEQEAFNATIADLNEKLANRQFDINDDLNDKLSDLQQNRVTEVKEAETSLQKSLDDIVKDGLDRREDFDRENAEALADIARDREQAITEITKEANEARLEAQTEYNEKVVEANKEATEALADAEKDRAEKIKEANAEAKESEQEIIDLRKETAEKLKDLNDEISKSYVDLADGLKESLKDVDDDFIKSVQDLRKNLAKDIKAINDEIANIGDPTGSAAQRRISELETSYNSTKNILEAQLKDQNKLADAEVTRMQLIRLANKQFELARQSGLDEIQLIDEKIKLQERLNELGTDPTDTSGLDELARLQELRVDMILGTNAIENVELAKLEQQKLEKIQEAQQKELDLQAELLTKKRELEAQYLVDKANLERDNNQKYREEYTKLQRDLQAEILGIQTETAQKLAEALKKIQEDFIASQTDIKAQLAKDLATYLSDLNKGIGDINKKANEDIAKAITDANQKLTDVGKQYSQQIAELESDLSRRKTEAEATYRDSLSKIEANYIAGVNKANSEARELQLVAQREHDRMVAEAAEASRLKAEDIEKKKNEAILALRADALSKIIALEELAAKNIAPMTQAQIAALAEIKAGLESGAVSAEELQRLSQVFVASSQAGIERFTAMQVSADAVFASANNSVAQFKAGAKGIEDAFKLTDKQLNELDASTKKVTQSVIKELPKIEVATKAVGETFNATGEVIKTEGTEAGKGYVTNVNKTMVAGQPVVKESGVDLGEKATEGFNNGMMTGMSTVKTKIISSLNTLVKGIGDGVAPVLKSAATGISNAFSTVFTNLQSSITTFLNNLKTTLTQIEAAIVKIIKAADAAQAAATKVNQTSTPSKPKPTAKGKIVNGPEVRLIGEAGPEAVVPLTPQKFAAFNKETGFMQRLASLLPSGMKAEDGMISDTGNYLADGTFGLTTKQIDQILAGQYTIFRSFSGIPMARLGDGSPIDPSLPKIIERLNEDAKEQAIIDKQRADAFARLAEVEATVKSFTDQAGADTSKAYEAFLEKFAELKQADTSGKFFGSYENQAVLNEFESGLKTFEQKINEAYQSVGFKAADIKSDNIISEDEVTGISQSKDETLQRIQGLFEERNVFLSDTLGRVTELNKPAPEFAPEPPPPPPPSSDDTRNEDFTFDSGPPEPPPDSSFNFPEFTAPDVSFPGVDTSAPAIPGAGGGLTMAVMEDLLSIFARSIEVGEINTQRIINADGENTDRELRAIYEVNDTLKVGRQQESSELAFLSSNIRHNQI